MRWRPWSAGCVAAIRRSWRESKTSACWWICVPCFRRKNRCWWRRCSARLVLGQHVHGRPPGWREPFDTDAPKYKVFSPAVAPRVEERLDLAAHRIDAREIRALLEIAALASQREVSGSS